MVVLAVAARQLPLAGIVFITVYVPTELADRLISPVMLFIKTNPAGLDVNAPALAPGANIGNGLFPFWQNVAPEYIKLAEGVVLPIVIITEFVFGQLSFVV